MSSFSSPHVKAAYAIYLGESEIHNSKYDSKDNIGGMKLFPDENDVSCYEELKKVIQIFINFRNLFNVQMPSLNVDAECQK